VGFPDGSGIGGYTAGASGKSDFWLGELATVTDAEVLGLAMSSEEACLVVASSSTAAISIAQNSLRRKPRS